MGTSWYQNIGLLYKLMENKHVEHEEVMVATILLFSV